jgi:hypothetical protein
MISPKTLLFTLADHSSSREASSYTQADEIVRRIADSLNGERARPTRVVVVFEDLFVWTTSLTVTHEDAGAQSCIQRAIQAEWEFNAGVRPKWWPETAEADRMWGVHYREDRDNGRAELARMRLERYDLGPVVLTPLPPRNSPSP